MPSRPTAARYRHSVALSLLLLLGACATGGRPVITPEAYASAQQAFRSDPAARTEAIAICIRARVGEPQVARELMAMLIEVDASEVDQVYCERLIQALAMGDISHADYNAIWTGHADAATSLRIIQALRLGSGPRLTADEFVGLRERLRHDAAYRHDRTRACTVQLEQLWSPVERSSWAADLGVDSEQVVRVYCERLNDAIATGRLGYEGWLALTTAGADPETRRRAMQVLRDEPGERA